MDTYLRLNSKELLEFNREVAKLNLEEKEAVLKITTSWKEEGILEGKAEGKTEGKTEGLLTGLRAPLRMRFGEEGLAFLATLSDGVGVDVLERVTDQVDSAPDLATLRRIAYENPGSAKAGNA